MHNLKVRSPLGFLFFYFLPNNVLKITVIVAQIFNWLKSRVLVYLPQKIPDNS